MVVRSRKPWRPEGRLWPQSKENWGGAECVWEEGSWAEGLEGVFQVGRCPGHLAFYMQASQSWPFPGIVSVSSPRVTCTRDSHQANSL